MKQNIVLPILPPRLNQVIGRKWFIVDRLKRDLTTALSLCARDQNIIPATLRRKVSLHVVLGPRRKQPDADAYDKLLLDALVRCGLLLDDSARGLVGRVEVTFARGPKDETRITLEDVE